ncbi:MAG TPA: 30S ribosomal protein S17 [bacterium]|nr:30S ribosomal protein S17 [bacterium]
MRTKTGIVTSTKMQKTVVVTVDTYKTHPKYHKRYKVSTKFYAHDEAGACVEGQKVVIRETRPLSRLKRWEVIETVA